MSEPLKTTMFTSDDLAAARAQFTKLLKDCPFCGGFSKPDPRRSPVSGAPVICLNEDFDRWLVRCFMCMAGSDGATADEAIENWNRRVGGMHAEQQLLPLVDLQSIARKCGVDLTPALESFARHLQADVLRLNRRPTC